MDHHSESHKILKMKRFWRASCLECASGNLGLPLKITLRACCVVGMFSSLLYVIAGTSIITHISQSSKATFSSSGDSSFIPTSASERTIHIYYSRNVGFFIGVSVVLVTLNLIQLLSDGLLFLSTFKKSRNGSLWVYMVLDIILWILSLVCFITIFSGGGLFLLLVFLIGTAIRVYITFILHEFMIEESKIHGDGNEDLEASQLPSESLRSLQGSPSSALTAAGCNNLNNKNTTTMENLDEEDENESDVNGGESDRIQNDVKTKTEKLHMDEEYASKNNSTDPQKGNKEGEGMNDNRNGKISSIVTISSYAEKSVNESPVEYNKGINVGGDREKLSLTLQPTFQHTSKIV